MKTFILTDLDDSLFSSARTHGGRTHLRSASLGINGEPVCFHSVEQLTMVQHLNQIGALIPVTGRSSESLARVISPVFSDFKIASHGAIILDPSGGILGSWYEQIQEELTEWGERLERALEYTQRWADIQTSSLRIRLIIDHDIKTYLSVKGDSPTLASLAHELAVIWGDGVIHHNNRNLALLPPYASKERAVRHLCERLKGLYDEPLLFIGVGDSVTDIPFLKLCDFALTPSQSHIHKELWS